MKIKLSSIMITIIAVFTTFVLTCFLSSCLIKHQIPLGNKPTKEFTSSPYLQDDAVFSGNSLLNLSGKTDAGVVMVATLYDSRNALVNQTYCYADQDGNWQLNIITPNISNKSYSLTLADGMNLYHQTYNNLRFGNVWLFIGDEFANYEYNDESNTITDIISDSSKDENVIDYNKMFYYQNKWVATNPEISQFGQTFLDQLYNKVKNPVALVFASAQDPLIYEWLSREEIVTNDTLKTYLDQENLYKAEGEQLELGDMSYLYENVLMSIKGMSYNNILVSQGSADLAKEKEAVEENQENFGNIYFRFYYSFLTQIEKMFEVGNKIYLLQETSNYYKNTVVLRGIQSRIANYFGDCEIIPTYDLIIVKDLISNIYYNRDNIATLTTDEETNLIVIGLDYDALSKRIITYLNEKSAPRLNDVVQDHTNNVIRLVFVNVSQFDEKDLLKGLVFYDENHEIVDLSYEVVNNEIIISLVTFNETNEEQIVKLSMIAYGQNNFILDCNLACKEQGVIPFVINFNNN